MEQKNAFIPADWLLKPIRSGQSPPKPKVRCHNKFNAGLAHGAWFSHVFKTHTLARYMSTQCCTKHHQDGACGTKQQAMQGSAGASPSTSDT